MVRSLGGRYAITKLRRPRGVTPLFASIVALSVAVALPGAAASSSTLTTGGSDATTSGAYATQVLADSPVSYWRLGETSGTTASDAAGSNAGSYAGGVTLGQP